MKLNTNFVVGQTIRFNYIHNETYSDGRGCDWNHQVSEKKLGKIVKLHPENKKTLEVKIRDEDKIVRLHPRNVIQIIPADCIPMTYEERYQFEIGKLYLEMGARFKKLSPYGQERVLEKLNEIQEIFDSKLSYKAD